MRNSFIIVATLISLFGASCTRQQTGHSLISIQLTDKNGLKQTISHEDRLKGFKNLDFHRPQPYEKVIRNYIDKTSKRDFSKITTYHPNGQIFQSLDVVAGRACGFYHEWYANGLRKVEVTVIEGPGDLTPASQCNWIFDGVSKAFDEHGYLEAEIHYDKGVLSGNSLYFYPQGQVKRAITFENGLESGTELFFDIKESIIKERAYSFGKLHGKSLCKNNSNEPNFSEYYEEGLLIEGDYFDFEGASIYKVADKNGYRPIFKEGKLQMVQTIDEGRVEGEMRCFNSQGHVVNTYFLKNNKKEGAEWVYFSGPGKKPKLYLEWKEDAICGISRSYYATGTVASEREMVDNKKQGLLTAYYEDGTLKIMETYDNDKLVHGKYMRKGEMDPTSVVENGSGKALFFDETGKQIQSVVYDKGKVLIDSEGTSD
ncbi:hypothetical protein COB21_03395 [Candidatus Aerophobetes bacterium]|uniref:Toxin-antitoxin system YwqK family antitoxin n=1 Tax=Aerophobetes bacterium TaxID=2030807 RepID=A0A2A4X4G7_UNCAE|nr:MAG: hypothetical protein COB21_03395 [Candidatus Aerophobetes bacterium]